MPGVMELLPREQIAFQRVLDVIRRNYERFGFLPVETPAIELSEMLLTKTGGETERQVYFVQSTGALDAFIGGVKKSAELSPEQKMHGIDYSEEKPEFALRFDLTVPLARYVAEHEHDLAFPFRRYQIQRVYRGEKQQAGRFREFYQADIDVIGKDALSIRFDAELPAVIHAVFTDLAIGPFTIQLNNRKIMRGFLEGLGIDDGEKQALVLREVDKLDKRGADAVRATLTGEGFGLSDAVAGKLLDFVRIRSKGHEDALSKLVALGSGTDTFNAGVTELCEVLEMVRSLGVPESGYAINLSIARGLDYYTGTVFETTLNDHPQIGSICSGGRYEDLASNYTKSKLPGVGISIGVTRLFYQLQKAGLIDRAESSVQVLVGLFDESRLHENLKIARELRAGGINTEVQLESRKLKKQFEYADRAGIRFVVLLGEDEAARGVVTIKDMRRGEQFQVARAELAGALRVEIEQTRAMDKGKKA
jgi:histidyl-tRNA synthetase